VFHVDVSIAVCFEYYVYRFWQCEFIGNVLVLESWLLQMEQNYWHCACVGTMVTTEGTELLALCLCWNHGYYRGNRIIGIVLVLESWLLHMEHNYWKCACVGTHMEQNYWHCACVGTIVSTDGTELFQSCELLTLV